MSTAPPVWCLAGPTAAGKSAICAGLAHDLPIEIINVDSATIYRGMDIGTAKPDAAERQRVPHHLLDIRDPAESYSVAQFCDDARRLIGEIRDRGHTPLLAGGTMMYFNALRKGLDDLPSADETIRREIEQKAQALGWAQMHEELAKVDPEAARRLAPGDSQRIGRALEVYAITGQPISSLWGQAQASEPIPNLRLISLEPSDRSILHQRIEQRFDAMLTKGLVNEVHALFKRGDLDPSMPSIRCVGYRQIWDMFSRGESLEIAREKAIAASRQLAKRQITWLRSMPERHVVDCLDTHAAQQVRALMTD